MYVVFFSGKPVNTLLYGTCPCLNCTEERQHFTLFQEERACVTPPHWLHRCIQKALYNSLILSHAWLSTDTTAFLQVLWKLLWVNCLGGQTGFCAVTISHTVLTCTCSQQHEVAVLYNDLLHYFIALLTAFFCMICTWKGVHSIYMYLNYFQSWLTHLGYLTFIHLIHWHNNGCLSCPTISHCSPWSSLGCSGSHTEGRVGRRDGRANASLQLLWHLLYHAELWNWQHTL